MIETPKPKRRWFQFSLRTLLVFVFVLSLALGWIGWKSEQTRREQAVLAPMEVGGGTVGYYESSLPPWIARHFRRVQGVGFSWHPAFDWSALAEFERLYTEQVSAVSSDVRSHNVYRIAPVIDVSPLTKLRDLEILDLRGLQVRNVSALTELGKLKKLDLRCTIVSSEDVEILRQALPECEIRH